MKIKWKRKKWSEEWQESYRRFKEREEWKFTKKQKEILDAYQKKLDNLTEDEIKIMQEAFDKEEL